MNKNYNYIFLFYDVKEKRVVKIFKICKKYLKHHQNSVFRGHITPSNIIKLESELKKASNKNEDKITILKFLSTNNFTEKNLGLESDKESIFI